MVPAELFNECWDEGSVGLEVLELRWVLEESYNTLGLLEKRHVNHFRAVTYKTDHVDHCGVSCNQHQEGHLDGIGPLNTARDELEY